MRTHEKVLVLQANGYYGNEVVSGIIQYSTGQCSWELYCLEIGFSGAYERAREAINGWKADGIIAHMADVDSRIVRMVRSCSLPVVNTSGHFESNFPPQVHADNEAIGRMAASHLLDQGFKQFGYFGFASKYSRRHALGFADAIAKAGLDCHEFDMPVASAATWDWRAGRPALSKWLLNLSKPVAIFCANDALAREVIWACRMVRLRVPEQVAILGTGNTPSVCLTCNPPLSSIDVGPHRIGYEAARLLGRLLLGRRPPDRPILLDPAAVVVRQSSDVLAIEDEVVVEALRFIREHVSQPINVADVTRAVPVSRRAIERRFLSALGRTPAQEIRRTRVERAKFLLSQTRLPLRRIAADCGFTRPALFSVIFRRQTGSTPSDYRASLHG